MALDSKQALLAVRCGVRLDELTLVFESAVAAERAGDIVGGAFLFVRPEWGCHHSLMVLLVENVTAMGDTIVVAVTQSSILVRQLRFRKSLREPCAFPFLSLKVCNQSDSSIASDPQHVIRNLDLTYISNHEQRRPRGFVAVTHAHPALSGPPAPGSSHHANSILAGSRASRLRAPGRSQAQGRLHGGVGMRGSQLGGSLWGVRALGQRGGASLNTTAAGPAMDTDDDDLSIKMVCFFSCFYLRCLTPGRLHGSSTASTSSLGQR